MLIIEALADGGVKMRLHRDTSLLLAAQTVYCSAKLLLDTGERPCRFNVPFFTGNARLLRDLPTAKSYGRARS